MQLQYHAVTVFEDDLVCAADSISPDYGASTVMLMKMDKFSPSLDNTDLLKDHLSNTPRILRVMHGGLQVAGQFRASFTFRPIVMQ